MPQITINYDAELDRLTDMSALCRSLADVLIEQRIRWRLAARGAAAISLFGFDPSATFGNGGEACRSRCR